MRSNLNPVIQYPKNIYVNHRRRHENADLRLAIIDFECIAEMIDVRRLNHQKRVMHLCNAIGNKIGLNRDTHKGLSISSSFHDVGLFSVREKILEKASALTGDEIALIREHPQIGYQLLQIVDFPWPVAEIVLQHHEHIDGSGYPNNLTGKKIRIEARIICVAEAVEAITSNRPHRPARTILEAVEEIKKGSGSLYDLNVVEAFLVLVHGMILQVKGWSEEI